MADSADVLIRPGQRLASRRWSRGGGRKTTRRALDITAVRRETVDAVALALSPSDGKSLAYAAGQYLTLYATIGGETVRRAYSISAPPHGDSLAVTVKAVDGGVFSHWAVHEARPGAQLHAAGPSGDFVLPATGPDVPHVFAAAGSGITPIVSMIESLLHERPDARVSLHYGNRREADIIFRNRLDALAAKHPRFEVHYRLTQPGSDWTGAQGRLTPEALLEQAADGAHFFLCGPGDCIDVLHSGLVQGGVDTQRIHSERFTAGVQAVTAHPTQPHPVHFALSGKEVTVRPGESVLEAGLRSGMDLPFSCTMGGCGHCKLQKHSGQLVMDEPNCLDDAEAEQGWFLACCSYPTERIEVAA